MIHRVNFVGAIARKHSMVKVDRNWVHRNVNGMVQ